MAKKNTGSKKISIRDISEQAGVSIATVSRVINRRGHYSQETEKRVQEIIQKNNFHLNSVARSLRTNMTHTVGLILPDMMNEFFAQIVIRIEMLLNRHRYTTTICSLRYGPQGIPKYSMLDLNNVSCIICPYRMDIDVSELSPDVPVVFLGYIPEKAQLHMPFAFIGTDTERASREATDALIVRNCRRIAFLTQNQHLWDHSYFQKSGRFLGYKSALAAHGIPFDDRLVAATTDSSAKSAFISTQMLLETSGGFDGICCNSSFSAVGAINAILDSGKKVPEDVKVISFDDTTMCRFFLPRISCVSVDYAQYADLAVNCAMELINGNRIEKNQFTVPYDIILRDST